MDKKRLVILFLIFFLALAIRIYNLPEYFVSSDAVTLPLFVIDSFPENINSFFSAANYGMNNPLRLVTYPYSILKPVYYFFLIGLLSFLNVPITEFTFFLPGIIVGSLTVFAAYFTVKKLYGPSSGILASILIMILPLHVMQSRYVTSPRTLAIFLHFIALYYLIIFLENPKKHAIQISILLSLIMTSSIMFPPFFLVAAYTFAAYNKKIIASFNQLKAYLRKNIITVRFLALPVITISFLVLIFLAVAGIGSSYGLNVTMLGHIITKHPSYGFYLLPVISYIFSGMGIFLGIISLLLIPFGIKDMIQLKRRGIFLIWALLYIIPFIFTSPSNVRAYIIDGVVPLAIYGVITLYEILSSQKLIRTAAISTLIILTALSTFSETYNLKIWSVTDIAPGEGSYLADYGVKALGYWARTNTPQDATFFFDDTIEPPVGKYYFHRKVYGLFDSNKEDTYQFFLKNKDKIDYMVVSKENYPLYQENSITIAESTSNDKTYYIISKRIYNNDVVKQIINVEKKKNLFDKKFSNLRSLQKAPLYVSQFAPWI